MNNGRARFFQNKDIDARDDFCKKYFYSETIKNDNEPVPMIFFCDANCTNNSTSLNKNKIGEYESFRTAPLCSYFYLMVLKMFHVTHNATPKMINNVRTNKLSRFFPKHVTTRVLLYSSQKIDYHKYKIRRN